jgi:translation initiation factor IF-3
LSRPFPPRSSSSSGAFVRVNGKIRAREVRVVASDGKQLGILNLGDALNMARQSGVDLVEIAPNATPPVCRLVDFGKYRYEQAKRDKESKKHQHANRVKEVQLSPKIDPHDLQVKIEHAVDFLSEDMKVKITLKFRGREMAHTEFGFQVVQKFLSEIAAYGQPDFQPKLIGRAINVLISPLPRNKRPKNPRQSETTPSAEHAAKGEAQVRGRSMPTATQVQETEAREQQEPEAPEEKQVFSNNPFGQLQAK